MIVYRIIRYDGEPDAVQRTLDRSIDGTYCPKGVKITACHVKGGINGMTPANVGKLLSEVEEKLWSPPDPPKPIPGAGSPLLIRRSTGGPGAQEEAAALVSRIDDMLDDGFGWASDTLNGIRETVLDRGYVTPGQLNAVDNIANARGGGR